LPISGPAVVDLPAHFVSAVREGRFREAATDRELQARGTQRDDPVARALLILAAAHHLALSGNIEGARLTFGRAVQSLEQAPLDAYAALLIEHARDSLNALQSGWPLPALPLDFRTSER
jgi:hypothetical protein